MSVKREFQLSEEDAAFIDARVSAGAGGPSDVVGEAIQMLRNEEALIERWLHEEVLPTYDRWKAGSEQVFTEEEVFEYLESVIEDSCKPDAAE